MRHTRARQKPLPCPQDTVLAVVLAKRYLHPPAQRRGTRSSSTPYPDQKKNTTVIPVVHTFGSSAWKVSALDGQVGPPRISFAPGFTLTFSEGLYGGTGLTHPRSAHTGGKKNDRLEGKQSPGSGGREKCAARVATTTELEQGRSARLTVAAGPASRRAIGG